MLVTFSWLDFLIFVLMLVLSLLVGVYFALRSKDKANDEFLRGSRSLTCLPVSMSLIVTYISAIAVQGGTAETYYHSIQSTVGNVGALALPLAAAIYIPFYYDLNITSINQYLEMRYNSLAARRVGSALFIIQILLNQAVVIYTPALALAAVTDVPIWASIVTVGAIASIYTAIGGIKAVVWTDAFQFIVLFGGLIVINVKGVSDAGGIERVWRVAVEHDRAGPQILNWQISIFERHTVWGLMWSGFLNNMSTFGCSQTAFQRYSSMKNLKHAYVSLLLLIPYGLLLTVLLSLAGLVLFATYVDCDPLAAGLITSKDQILPFYVMHRLSSTPGLAGVFVACIFSGALSTISSGVNSQAAVTWEDWLSMSDCCRKLPISTQTFITKLIAFGYGIAAIGLAFIAGSMGGVLQAAVAVTFAVAGPLYAAFNLAIFVPFSNAKGSCASMIVGTLLSLGLYFGATGLGLTPQLLPTSTDGCPANITIPQLSNTPVITVDDLDYPKKLLGISYSLLGTVGFVTATVIGILVSVATGGNGGRPIKRHLVHKWVWWALPNPDESYHKNRHTSCTRL